MARKIGIFDTERQAINAIQQLEQAGFLPGELRVLAKDSVHSRRIEAECDVHADELNELEDDSSPDRGAGLFGAGPSGYAGLAAAPVFGTSGYGTPAYAGGAYPFAAVFLGSDNGHSETLHAIGLDDDEAEACGNAIQSGSVVVIAQTDESKSLLDKDGGPDLSRLAAAEAVFRGCNAANIVSGA